jgi:hypothetical protein
MIDQRRESPNLVERLAAHSQRGAETVMQAAFNHLGEQYAGLEVGGDAQPLKP